MSAVLPRQILNDPVYLPYVPHRASVTQHVELTFLRRGRYSQEGFSVSSKFPFGFMKKTREVPARQEILVLPAIEPTERFSAVLPLVSGEVESFFRGHGHDLYTIRDYQESDTVRHVDWKASARSQHLKVREFTREDDRRVILIFDVRVADSNPRTLEQFEKAVNLCACLAWHFSEIDSQLQFVTRDINTGMAPGRAVIYPALEALALIEPRVERQPGNVPELGWPAEALTATGGFHIVISCQSTESFANLPANAAHVISMASL
jgi:uncharacterized protein (DUF58 family)